MRTHFATLLPGVFLLHQCAHTPAPVPAASKASDNATVAWGIPGPKPNYRTVSAQDVRQNDTVYAATLPVRQDPDGTLRVRVKVNPQAHTLDKLSVLFTPRDTAVKVSQVGYGTSVYDPKTGHYYFDVLYDKRRKSSRAIDQPSGWVISGWVEPTTSTAAVLLRALPDE